MKTEKQGKHMVGVINLVGLELKCFILDNGVRAILASDLLEAYGIIGAESTVNGDELGNTLMEGDLSSRAKSKIGLFVPLKATIESKGIYVFDAKTLLHVKNLFSSIEKIEYTEQQRGIRKLSLKVFKDFNYLSILELIDNSLNYDFHIELDELEKKLELILHKDFIQVMKKFPIDYYKLMFNLNKWGNFKEAINRRIVPGKISEWTKEYVFYRLSKEVLEQLKEIGSERSDESHPSLDMQMNSIITVMKLSKTWKAFEKQFKQIHGEVDSPDDSIFEPNIKSSDFSNWIQKAVEYNPNNDKRNK